MYSGYSMNRYEDGFVQDHKDPKEVDTYIEVGGGDYLEAVYETSGEHSRATSADRNGFIDRTGSIGCSAFGSKRCDFRAE